MMVESVMLFILMRREPSWGSCCNWSSKGNVGSTSLGDLRVGLEKGRGVEGIGVVGRGKGEDSFLSWAFNLGEEELAVGERMGLEGVLKEGGGGKGRALERALE